MQVQVLSPAPRRCGRHIVRSDFFAKVASHSFCRSSFPNRTRCRWASIRLFILIGAPFLSMLPTSLRTAYRSQRLFCKSRFSLILSQLLSKPDPLSLGSGLVFGERHKSCIAIRTTSEQSPLCSGLFFACGFKNKPSARSLAPPLRKRSRSARLLGCKRPRGGSLSLPPAKSRSLQNFPQMSFLLPVDMLLRTTYPSRRCFFLASGGALFSKEHREIEFENIYRTDAAANSGTPRSQIL